MFYLLSLLTGILECGWIAFGVMNSLPLWQVLCFPLAYHIGNLFPKPFSLGRGCLSAMAALSVLVGSLTFALERTSAASLVLTCVSLLLTSAVMQSVRSSIKSDGNRLIKRVFRVVGFALSPLAVFFPSFILVLSAAVSMLGLRNYSGSCGISVMRSQNGCSAVMLFHQLHYFFYAHITLAAVGMILSAADPSYGVFFSALLFCGTWATYMSVEPVVSRITSKVLPVFFVGHIGISLLLAGMSVISDVPYFIGMWLITGFGGGVVYTISAKAKESGCFDKTSMTISENIGHTAGLLSAVIVAAAIQEQAPRVMLAAGSASALLAVISMLVVIRKEKHNETVANKG